MEGAGTGSSHGGHNVKVLGDFTPLVTNSPSYGLQLSAGHTVEDNVKIEGVAKKTPQNLRNCTRATVDVH